MITLILSSLFITTFFTYSYYILAQYQQPPAFKSSNLLLLTAHPDDECMFFGPTLAYLRNFSRNAAGLGDIRKKELIKSGQKFDIPATHVKSLDHPELQDGMKTEWQSSVISDQLSDYVKKHKIDTVVTFDSQGVSGHPNHIAAYLGAKDYASRNDNVQLYTLKSISVIRKYIALVDLMVMAILQRLHPNTATASAAVFISSPGAYLLTHKAMRQHHSQLVWFRWLYVTFSRYMFVNELRKVG